MNMTNRVALLAMLAALGLGAGCQTGGQTGALTGAGIGALIGNAAGGDSEATLIGAAVGTGIGYIIGNEDDKRHARDMTRTAPPPTYAHTEVGTLGGTRWELISLAPHDAFAPYLSKVFDFRRNGRVVTTTTAPDGSLSVTDERYRVVGRTLIINREGYLVNAAYRIDGNEMIIDADVFRAVLRRLRS